MKEELERAYNKIEELLTLSEEHSTEKKMLLLKDIKSEILRVEDELEYAKRKESKDGIGKSALERLFYSIDSISTLIDEGYTDAVNVELLYDYISINDFLLVARRINEKYLDVQRRYHKLLNKREIDGYSNFRITGFDSKNSSLYVTGQIVSDWDFRFYKSGGKMYADASYYNSNKILRELGIVLSDAYDELFEVEKHDMKKIHSKMTTANGDFQVKICDGKVLVGVDYIADPVLTAYIQSNFISIINNTDIKKQLEGREKELLNKLYLRIADLPVHMQEELREYKKAKIEKNERKKLPFYKRMFN